MRRRGRHHLNLLKEEYTMYGNRLAACRPLAFAGIVTILLFATTALSGSAYAQGQKRFGSPEEAAQGLVEAIRSASDDLLMAILGPDSKELVFSGDEVADKRGREWFLRAYKEKNLLAHRSAEKAILEIGKDSWPFPIPLIRKGDGWYYDTAAGKAEILNRRIGRNELNAIEVCRAFVEAQKEYMNGDWDEDGVMEYAQKITSSPGKRDGLFWPAGEGETESPLGPLIAKASTEGYAGSGDGPQPYHGYFFRILRSQGKNAPGGAYRYVINGNMVAGFAVLALPAVYGSSGIMTFVVNQNGIVYEKDLGPNTGKLVKTMKAYDPDKTWKRAK
jgi:hypothetical protein